MKGVAKNQPRARNERVSNTRQRRQQHLLDVKVRSHKATQYRNKRILVVASKLVLAGVIVASLVYGVRFGAKRIFFDNPDYRLSRIEVKTDGSLQREQILHEAGLREGENIFSVNLAQVRDQLQQLPQVDEVQVTRNLPNEINIQIVERKPIAWITSESEMGDPFASEGAFLIDAHGTLMREKKLLREYLGLPVIVGCRDDSLESGKAVESPEARAALDLLRLSARSFMQTRFQVREIDLSTGYGLVVTDKNHTRVTFGFDNLEAQVQRLEQFLVWADESRREIETLNLLVQRNIPVTFTRTAAQVIDDTFDPNDEGKILRAEPVNPNDKVRPPAGAGKAKKAGAEANVRRAIPVESGRKIKHGEQ